MALLTHIFYALAILAIIYEIRCISNPGKAVLMQLMLGSDDFSKAYAFTMFLYAIWAFIGLFTHLWLYFMALLLLSILMPKNTKATAAITSIAALMILFLILINKYIL